MKDRITSFIDFFHPPFRSFIDKKTFRYLACGGSNTLLDILLFFLSYNFIFKKEVVHLPFVAISPYIAAFLFAFIITFPIGFTLMRHIVFTDSILKGRVQLVRYLMLVTVNIFLNYIFLKIFVEYVGLYPTVAKVITTVIIVIFSYLTQKYFTFKAEVAKN
jgi:putative flippase GtrA